MHLVMFYVVARTLSEIKLLIDSKQTVGHQQLFANMCAGVFASHCDDFNFKPLYVDDSDGSNDVIHS